ncbi:hypothetical protein RchiOBHm_Chr5g0060171 [Rosa chinensis]|uniref:Uncharacterized protein n=1 Tax=Rosa chinensis TaxID=74649 RepID=A0A2P6QHM4_ROSCH|nr:hypothetical protein RchiOBHm_Chr5g0060171 [Rosa chinensis]
MVIGTLLGMIIWTLLGMIIWTLPGMVHRDAARHGSSLTPKGVVVEGPATEKKRWWKSMEGSLNLLSSELLSPSSFPRCCAPLHPPLFALHVVLIYCTIDEFGL